MPQLPVRLNVELANNFLPRATANGMCHMQHLPMQAMPGGCKSIPPPVPPPPAGCWLACPAS